MSVASTTGLRFAVRGGAALTWRSNRRRHPLDGDRGDLDPARLGARGAVLDGDVAQELGRLDCASTVAVAVLASSARRR